MDVDDVVGGMGSLCRPPAFLDHPETSGTKHGATYHRILRFVLPIYLPIFSQEKCNRYAFIVAGKDLSIESCLFLDLQG